MGFLDFFKNLFGKKQPPPTSPSEQGGVQIPPNGQFGVPQNPADTQTPPTPPSPQAGQGENPTT